MAAWVRHSHVTIAGFIHALEKVQERLVGRKQANKLFSAGSQSKRDNKKKV